jgi:hypothetical protein
MSMVSTDVGVGPFDSVTADVVRHANVVLPNSSQR